MMLKKYLSPVLLCVFIVIISIFSFTYIDIQELIKHLETLPKEIMMLGNIGLIILQIVLAFLPGEPLELASGYLFGAMGGTVICLIASFIGTFIVYYLVRLFKYSIINKMFKKEKVDEVVRMLSTKKSQLGTFLLFLIPGSPKDIMTYVVSLSDIQIGKWLLIATIGRIPSIITSTFLSNSLREGNVLVAGIIFVITMFMVAIGVVYYKKMVNEEVSL